MLANSRVALVIENVGDSDFFDPWGGRPVGLSTMNQGDLNAPANLGELFVLTGGSTVMTEVVSVIADGSDGGTAIVRASGKLRRLPFLAAMTSEVFPDDLSDIHAAIDYELAPDARFVVVRMRYASPRQEDTTIASTLHALTHTVRTPVFVPGTGFVPSAIHTAPYFVVDNPYSTSWGYIPGEGPFSSSLSMAGVAGAYAPGFTIPACTTSERVHAKLVIGGLAGSHDIAGVQGAASLLVGQALRRIIGVFYDEQGMQLFLYGAHVHAVDSVTGEYYSRGTTDSGAFVVHAPEQSSIRLDVIEDHDPTSPMSASIEIGTESSNHWMIPWPASRNGAIRVRANEGIPACDQCSSIPVRIQAVPAAGQQIPTFPDRYGERARQPDRLFVRHTHGGNFGVPAGAWELIVSHGFEYELERRTFDVAAGAQLDFDARLVRSVATPGVQCGDFHVHTSTSHDARAGDYETASQAVGDGVELLVRSEHDYVADFSGNLIGLESWAASFGSVELSSGSWGHIGVFPLTPDPGSVNGGAPRWQSFPTPADPDVPVETLSPLAVFESVRARPEAPLVIINHPRGGSNYFDHVGLDPATGMVDLVADWDTAFTVIEVFSGSGWLENRTGSVEDWLALLRAGRHVFATGSSDSHGVWSSPVGYPRTCVAVGTDDPRQVTASGLRDQLAAGHATVSGGIYVTATIGGAGPGDTTTGAGTLQSVALTVQAATWIDVTAIEVIVDGITVDTIPVMPGDAAPGNPAMRWSGTIPIQVRATGGFVIIAAYGTQALEPVHPGKVPFGVSNPIFVVP